MGSGRVEVFERHGRGATGSGLLERCEAHFMPSWKTTRPAMRSDPPVDIGGYDVVFVVRQSGHVFESAYFIPNCVKSSVATPDDEDTVVVGTG